MGPAPATTSVALRDCCPLGRRRGPRYEAVKVAVGEKPARTPLALMLRANEVAAGILSAATVKWMGDVNPLPVPRVAPPSSLTVTATLVPAPDHVTVTSRPVKRAPLLDVTTSVLQVTGPVPKFRLVFEHFTVTGSGFAGGESVVWLPVPFPAGAELLLDDEADPVVLDEEEPLAVALCCDVVELEEAGVVVDEFAAGPAPVVLVELADPSTVLSEPLGEGLEQPERSKSRQNAATTRRITSRLVAPYSMLQARRKSALRRSKKASRPSACSRVRNAAA